MILTELSSEAKAICKDNYQKDCGICPLRKACIATPLLTWENNEKWIVNLNDLASEVRGKESCNN
ncbi:hypothetical protein OKW24_005733 [Peribacillus simplex]|uniref:hypothetical protein n=1 Tax=Peribacillus simplex TaxID=1478 RepID=UPI0024E24C49|nr:hypothetical protein [Peribacillus simplex]MDF9763837.1 hypothetical protein [Peribacillus simplex]